MARSLLQVRHGCRAFASTAGCACRARRAGADRVRRPRSHAAGRHGDRSSSPRAAPSSPVPTAVWDDVQRFYAARMYAPRWVGDGDEEQAAAALRVVQRAPEHGLTAARLRRRRSATPARLEAVDRRRRSARTWRRSRGSTCAITTALLTLGRDVARGPHQPRVHRPALEGARARRRISPPRWRSAADATACRRLARHAFVRCIRSTRRCRRRSRRSARSWAAAPTRRRTRAAASRSTSNAGAGCPTISARATSWSTSRRSRWRCARTGSRCSR